MWRTRISTTMFTTMWLSYDLPLCSSVACVIASNCNHASQCPLAWSLVTHSFRWNSGWDFPLVLMLFLWQIRGMSINVIFIFYVLIYWGLEGFILHILYRCCSSCFYSMLIYAFDCFFCIIWTFGILPIVH